jgi:lysophospholipid acyltransferase (LPLAT)-like uncharacterized protein
MRIDYLSCWTLKTWDRFRLPKPFSRVRVVLEGPFSVPRALDVDRFEQERLGLENLLNKGITDRVEDEGANH